MKDITKRDFVKAAAGGVLFSKTTGIAFAQTQPVQLSNLNAPASADVGSDIRVTVDVQNVGTRQTTVDLVYRFNGRVRASKSQTLDDGQSVRVEFNPSLPGDLSAGSYQHGVFVSGTDQGVTSSITLTTPDQQVFDVSNFSGPSQVLPGQSVTAEAVVRNSGTGGGTTSVQYRIGNQPVASRDVTLDAGESRAVTFQGQVPNLSPGTYQQGVFIGSTSVGQSTSVVVGSQPSQFSVLSLQTQSEGRVGDQISATATVRNVSSSSGSSTFEYRIGNRTVASRNVSLDAGQQTTIQLSGSVPNLPAGSYSQGVFLAGTNNGLTTQFTVQTAAASFAVESLSAPSRLETGQTSSARATVRNTGNRRGTTTFQYRIDGTTVSTREVELSAGASREITLEGTVPDRSSGTYQQGVFVGGTSVGLTSTVRITQGPGANFTVSRLRAPSTAETESPIRVTATVTNTGSSRDSTDVEYRIDGSRLGRQEVDLRGGRSTTVTFDVTVPDLRRGAYTQGVFVGRTGRGLTSSLRIIKRARFAISGLQTTPSATVGDRISARATLTNTGDSPSRKRVEYRIGSTVVAETELQLNPDQTRTLTLSGTVPQVAGGTYLQGFFVDGESATTNLTVRTPPPAQGNLTIANFQAPSRVTVGDSISVEATIRNTGDATGTGRIEYRIDNRVLATQQVTLDAGTEQSLTFDVDVPNLSTGTHQQGVYVTGTGRNRTREIVVEAAATETPTDSPTATPTDTTGGFGPGFGLGGTAAGVAALSGLGYLYRRVGNVPSGSNAEDDE